MYTNLLHKYTLVYHTFYYIGMYVQAPAAYCNILYLLTRARADVRVFAAQLCARGGRALFGALQRASFTLLC